MVDRNRVAIFMYQSEGRARNLIGGSGSAAFHDPLGERSLSGAEISNQQHDPVPRQQTGKLSSYVSCLLVRVGLKP
jgi:hypothetical protein